MAGAAGKAKAGELPAADAFEVIREINSLDETASFTCQKNLEETRRQLEQVQNDLHKHSSAARSKYPCSGRNRNLPSNSKNWSLRKHAWNS